MHEENKAEVMASFKSRWQHDLMTPKLVETYTSGGLKENTLANWRSTQRYTIPYVKAGRKILYRRIDIDEFLARRTVGGGNAS